MKAKIAIVFSEKLKGLSAEIQKIFLDDIVLTFENRLKALNQYNQRGQEPQRNLAEQRC